MIQILRETHEPPPEIARILRIGGGLNTFGEPNYRLVWGRSRMDWIGGKWEDRDADGSLIREVYELRYVPKYDIDRWVIERWVPPETYGSPYLWNLQNLEKSDSGEFIPQLGPYPSRGDYEGVFTLETSDGKFIQITPTIARAFVACLEMSRETGTETLTEKKSKRYAKDEREYDNYADSVLNDGSTITGPMVTVL